MGNRSELEAVFKRHGFVDFKWIKAADIVVAQWVRMKCMFGCPEYGQSACCPPQTPSVAECERFVREYTEAVVFHFAKVAPEREKRWEWSRTTDLGLVAVERDVFLAGYPRVFLMYLGSCHLCEECGEERETCVHPEEARPTPEALAIDVFTTVRKYGYPIEVVTDYGDEMNRYAFLMVE
jgi:predicted metal-binding protein